MLVTSLVNFGFLITWQRTVPTAEMLMYQVSQLRVAKSLSCPYAKQKGIVYTYNVHFSPQEESNSLLWADKCRKLVLENRYPHLSPVKSMLYNLVWPPTGTIM